MECEKKGSVTKKGGVEKMGEKTIGMEKKE